MAFWGGKSHIFFAGTQLISDTDGGITLAFHGISLGAQGGSQDPFFLVKLGYAASQAIHYKWKNPLFTES